MHLMDRIKGIHRHQRVLRRTWTSSSCLNIWFNSKILYRLKVVKKAIPLVLSGAMLESQPVWYQEKLRWTIMERSHQPEETNLQVSKVIRPQRRTLIPQSEELHRAAIINQIVTHHSQLWQWHPIPPATSYQLGFETQAAAPCSAWVVEWIIQTLGKLHNQVVHKIWIHLTTKSKNSQPLERV